VVGIGAAEISRVEGDETMIFIVAGPEVARCVEGEIGKIGRGARVAQVYPRGVVLASRERRARVRLVRTGVLNRSVPFNATAFGLAVLPGINESSTL
jgi:hypothetical protein